jgi:hypothetical protein
MLRKMDGTRSRILVHIIGFVKLQDEYAITAYSPFLAALCTNRYTRL